MSETPTVWKSLRRALSPARAETPPPEGAKAAAAALSSASREVLEAYRNNPRALDALRAPIYEDKVVDHILGTVTLTDRSVTPEELAREDEETL